MLNKTLKERYNNKGKEVTITHRIKKQVKQMAVTDPT